MKTCVQCGSSLPDSHPHRTCSMCYGDLDYGTDGYYRSYMERQQEVAPSPDGNEESK